jgi:hypothetical protein
MQAMNIGLGTFAAPDGIFTQVPIQCRRTPDLPNPVGLGGMHQALCPPYRPGMGIC